MPAQTKTKTLPPDLRARIGKLVLMLSSPHDGERSAAAAAIGKALASAGYDWHDFAAGYAAPSAASPMPPPPPPSPPPLRPKPPPSPSQFTDGSMQVGRVELADLVKQLLDTHPRLNSASQDFLESLAERAESYDVVFISVKQRSWLQDLVRQSGIKWK